MSAQTAAVSEVGVDDKDALSMGQLMMPPPPPPPVILEAEINVLSQSLAVSRYLIFQSMTFSALFREYRNKNGTYL